MYVSSFTFGFGFGFTSLTHPALSLVLYFMFKLSPTAIPTSCTRFESFDLIDTKTFAAPVKIRYLLGDYSGTLHMLFLSHNGSKITSLSTKVMGVTSISSCLCHLESGVVYNGSNYGDSQLLRLLPECKFMPFVNS